MRSVRLDDELERRLAEAAKLTNTPISEIVRDAIRQKCDQVLSDKLYPRIADIVGSVSGNGKYDSRDTGRAFAEILLKKQAKWARRK
jgi:hypothetical protein